MGNMEGAPNRSAVNDGEQQLAFDDLFVGARVEVRCGPDTSLTWHPMTLVHLDASSQSAIGACDDGQIFGCGPRNEPIKVDELRAPAAEIITLSETFGVPETEVRRLLNEAGWRKGTVPSPKQQAVVTWALERTELIEVYVTKGYPREMVKKVFTQSSSRQHAEKKLQRTALVQLLASQATHGGPRVFFEDSPLWPQAVVRLPGAIFDAIRSVTSYLSASLATQYEDWGARTAMDPVTELGNREGLPPEIAQLADVLNVEGSCEWRPVAAAHAALCFAKDMTSLRTPLTLKKIPCKDKWMAPRFTWWIDQVCIVSSRIAEVWMDGREPKGGKTLHPIAPDAELSPGMQR